MLTGKLLKSYDAPMRVDETLEGGSFEIASSEQVAWSNRQISLSWSVIRGLGANCVGTTQPVRLFYSNLH